MTSAYAESPDEYSYNDMPLNNGMEIEEQPTSVSSDAAEAVLYLRVSSKKQMDTDADFDPEGNSIPTQRRKGQAKADELGVEIWGEYVEPGRSATSLEKRKAFQLMMAEVAAENRRRKKTGEQPIRYVIVYMMSRAFRNALEELQTKAHLAKMGITLVSAKENFGDGYLGDAMQGILAIFNELQVRMSGDDIRTKMANKARNGGTIGRAPIGYLNITKLIEGRHVRTVIVDPQRGPLVRLAFELFATGECSQDDLQEELYDRGLRTRATAKYSEQALSTSQIGLMLRNRYYIGYIEYEGEEIKGRHEPLIDEDLFERVQEVLDARGVAGERRRTHHHYLKGSLFCRRCKRVGITQRMIIQHTVGRAGTAYTYFFCRNKQTGACDAPHINVLLVEDAVEAHYATIRFSRSFIDEVRLHLDDAIRDQEQAERLLHEQLSSELQALDAQENNLIELAASGLAQDKIKTRLRELGRQRQHLRERLAVVNDELSDSARLIEVCLTLLEDPQALYRRCDDEQRRLLNQAIFQGLYIDEEEAIDSELKEPFAQLQSLQRVHHLTQTDKPDPGASKTATQAQSASRATLGVRSGPASASYVQVVLGRTDLGQCSSKPYEVGDTGFEPVASSV